MVPMRMLLKAGISETFIRVRGLRSPPNGVFKRLPGGAYGAALGPDFSDPCVCLFVCLSVVSGRPGGGSGWKRQKDWFEANKQKW